MVQRDQDDELGYFAVAFLDVLGQKERIRQLTGLPTNQTELDAAMRVLRDTVGYLRRLRSMFDSIFQGIDAPTPVFDSIPEDKKPLAMEMRKSEVNYSWFSDSLIAAVPLRRDDEHCRSMNGIFATMWASAGVSLGALAEGMRIRGAIDVGWGIEIEPDEVYGAALERAYTLESEVADYPRIVVGDELWRYLDFVSGLEMRTPFGRLAQDVAGQCRALVVKDDDGRRVVDLAGPLVAAMGEPLGPMVRKRAIQQVERQVKEWADANNEKLARRYERLLRLLRDGANRQGNGLPT